MVERFVNNAIRYPVVVFSKTYCPYCTRVKEMLGEAGVKDLHVIELDQRADGDDVQEVLRRSTGARTVPRVFIGGKSVGGSADVAALVNSGQLQSKLKEAGAITEAMTVNAYSLPIAAAVAVGVVIALVYIFRRTM